VVIATGRVDAEFSPAMLAQPQIEALPFGHLERFEQLGHLGPLQDPDVVAASILASAG
jgi:pimeloyl-ACP methyl ester carboxylesterase